MIEKALVEEIKTNIPEIEERLYPVDVPEGTDCPCVAYCRIESNEAKSLSGYLGDMSRSYMLSILCPTYKEMIEIRKKVENLIKGFVQKTIGTDKVYIQDIDINDINETFEINLMLYRGIIEFTIYYKE